MRGWRLAGFCVMTCRVVLSVSASGTGGGGANGATRDSLIGTRWNLVALAGELLCLGHTHQPGYRAVLERLSALPFVAEIHEALFE